jgi:hypothetical protein
LWLLRFWGAFDPENMGIFWAGSSVARYFLLDFLAGTEERR